MPALPVPAAPLTAAQYAALPEDETYRLELQEGVFVVSPRPVPRHQMCLSLLQTQLRPQLPAHLELLPEVDVDLQLLPPEAPGTVRVPDLAVVTRAAFERVDREGGLLRAADLLLAVEIVSPSSRRMDVVVKAGEYADAGVPRYWVLDIDEDPRLTVHHLAGEFGYVQDAPGHGVFTADEPFPLHLDLGQLR